jgi:hypothetical protein
MAGANELELVTGVEEKICRHPKHPPSVSLLKELLINGLTIFKIPVDRSGGHAQAMNMLWTLEAELPLTFFNYLSSLQSYAKDPKCMEKFIPDLAYFMERTKYLESDIDTKELLKPREKLVNIFEKIENIKEVYKRCQTSAKNGSQSIKKKSNVNSTPNPTTPVTTPDPLRKKN